jgi:tetraacyldisaccharide 4'-kinase
MKFLKIFLAPFALIYKIIVQCRNFFFNIGIIKQHIFDIPIISVGNLAVGGTGKTPHVEHLVKILKDNYKIAVLSRGYKRKTKGFLVVNNQHLSKDVGDEPMQYKQKFGDDVVIAVAERRVKGIRKIKKSYPTIDVIILDDAFQHRHVKPGLSVMLSDYHHPFYSDHIMPLGKLREPRKNYKRADIIIMSKTPFVFSPIIIKKIQRKISLFPHQKLFFSSVDHLEPKAIFPSHIKLNSFDEASVCFLLTGIANPYPLKECLYRKFTELNAYAFPDHHEFTVKDIQGVKKDFNKHFSKNKIIVTTEKDMMRLTSREIKKEIVDLPIFYIPIKTKINEEEKYKKIITDYVEKNRRNT